MTNLLARALLILACLLALPTASLAAAVGCRVPQEARAAESAPATRAESGPAPAPAFVTGRLLGEDGKPVVSAKLISRVVLRRAGGRTSTPFDLSTDARGRFRREVDAPFDVAEKDLIRELRISDPVNNGDPAGADKPESRPGERRTVVVDLSRELGPGDVDIGDAKMARPPGFASGVVVDPKGKPVAGVAVRVVSRATTGGFVGDSAVNSLADITDAAGRFELRGTSRLKNLFAFAALEPPEDADADLPDDKSGVPLAVGKRDVRLVMEPVGTKGAAPRTPPIFTRQLITDLGDESTAMSGPHEHVWSLALRLKLDADGTCAWSPSQPGEYTVALWVRRRQDRRSSASSIAGCTAQVTVTEADEPIEVAIPRPTQAVLDRAILDINRPRSGR